jgi:iron complex transport system substrate-binding protein
MPTPHRPRVPVLLSLLCAALTAACGTAPAAAPTAGADQASAPAGFPVTVQNCGRDITFEEPPERIVTGWITATELLIELGAADRIVGLYNTSAFGSPRPEVADAYSALPVLSDAAPSREALLGAAPDLVYADGNYLFDGTQLPTVDELAAAGTQVIVLSGFCDDGGASAVLDVQEDLAALGSVLDVEGRAAELSAEVDRRLAAVAPVPDGPAVAVVSGAEGALYTYEGVYTDMVERAGATNVYAGTLPEGTYFGQLSVEDLTAKDPGTLVYLLTGAETEDAARTFLTSTLPTVTAVQQDRIVFVPSEDSSNLRAVDGVEQLTEGLRSLG